MISLTDPTLWSKDPHNHDEPHLWLQLLEAYGGCWVVEAPVHYWFEGCRDYCGKWFQGWWKTIGPIFKLIIIWRLDLRYIWQLLRVLAILGVEDIQIPEQVVWKYFLFVKVFVLLDGAELLAEVGPGLGGEDHQGDDEEDKRDLGSWAQWQTIVGPSWDF